MGNPALSAGLPERALAGGVSDMMPGGGWGP